MRGSITCIHTTSCQEFVSFLEGVLSGGCPLFNRGTTVYFSLGLQDAFTKTGGATLDEPTCLSSVKK